jgi:hypothetical protein
MFRMRWVLIGILAAAVAGCGAGPPTTPTDSVTGAPTATPDISITPSAPPPTALGPAAAPSLPNGLIGIGSEDSAWQARHVLDLRFGPGSAYDPTPGLGPDAQHEDRYFGVVHEAGVIWSFTERLKNKTSLPSARKAALAELPPDGRVAWSETLSRCVEEELDSATLAKALGGGSKGGVLVEFLSATAKGHGYDPTNVNEVFLKLGDFASPAAATRCG